MSRPLTVFILTRGVYAKGSRTSDGPRGYRALIVTSGHQTTMATTSECPTREAAMDRARKRCTKEGWTIKAEHP